ncbi:MAG: DsbA family protein [Gammaproteobacteria bacterium]|nr:DsbA family protein [Gammaproteobacteria bacterium]
MSVVELAIDFSSADSYLAFGPTLDLVCDIDAELCLHPFRVELTRIDHVDENSSVEMRHQFVRNSYRELNVVRYARVQKLPPLRTNPYEDTSTALKGLALANKSDSTLGVLYAERIFLSYWHDSKFDIEDTECVLECLEEVGVSATSNQLAQTDLTLIREELQGKGVIGVPMYLVKGEVFQGRQHLPWIRELLT